LDLCPVETFDHETEIGLAILGDKGAFLATKEAVDGFYGSTYYIGLVGIAEEDFMVSVVED
jgi:hypothetical protein